MDCFTDFYEQLERLTAIPEPEVDENGNAIGDAFTVDISNPQTTPVYFEKVDQFTSMLVSFYERYIAEAKMHQVLHERMNTRRRKNYDDLKLMLMVDIDRAYEGLDHPTRLQSPEGIALFMLLVKLFCPDYFITYDGLASIPTDIINLDGIVPYVSACSEQIDTSKEESVISSLLQEAHPKADRTYRICLYHLFEAVSEVDGVISQSEKEYLMTLLHLDDDDVSNDIDIETSISLK